MQCRRCGGRVKASWRSPGRGCSRRKCTKERLQETVGKNVHGGDRHEPKWWKENRRAEHRGLKNGVRWHCEYTRDTELKLGSLCVMQLGVGQGRTLKGAGGIRIRARGLVIAVSFWSGRGGKTGVRKASGCHVKKGRGWCREGKWRWKVDGHYLLFIILWDS